MYQIIGGGLKKNLPNGGDYGIEPTLGLLYPFVKFSPSFA